MERRGNGQKGGGGVRAKGQQRPAGPRKPAAAAATGAEIILPKKGRNMMGRGLHMNKE
jgi:hypothetical protein